MWIVRIRRFGFRGEPREAGPDEYDQNGLSLRDRRGRRILEVGLLALLAWAPLPIASVAPWSPTTAAVRPLRSSVSGADIGATVAQLPRVRLQPGGNAH